MSNSTLPGTNPVITREPRPRYSRWLLRGLYVGALALGAAGAAEQITSKGPEFGIVNIRMSNSFDNVQGGQGGGMLDQRELARIAAYEQDIAETRHDRDIDWYVASGLGVTAIVTAASRAVAESMERRIPLAGAPQPAAGPSAQ